MKELDELLRGRRRALVVHGDALDVLRMLPAGSVDATVTDPPYSSGGAFRGDRARPPSRKYSKGSPHPDFEGDTRDQLAQLTWCVMWMSLCRRVSKVGAPICVFTDWRQHALTDIALQSAGWTVRGMLPWNKKGAGRPQRGRFRQDAEFVIWGSNGPMPFNRQIGGGLRVLPGELRAAPVPARKRLALTAKPDEVLRDLVRVCRPGGLILDPFVGGGSTGRAALTEGYRFLGVDITEAYARRALKSIAAMVA